MLLDGLILCFGLYRIRNQFHRSITGGTILHIPIAVVWVVRALDCHSGHGGVSSLWPLRPANMRRTTWLISSPLGNAGRGNELAVFGQFSSLFQIGHSLVELALDHILRSLDFVLV